MTTSARGARVWFLIAACFAATHALFASNVIQTENAKAGDPNWQLASEAHGEIEGYASATSVNRGEQISLFVSTIAPTYTLSIYRLGWYGGIGGRLMLGPIARNGVHQPTPPPDAHGMIECNWTDPYVLNIPNNANDPSDWASGVYVAKLSASSGKESYIVFIVRDDARHANHYFVSSTNTAQAYNLWGGESLYGDAQTNRPQARMVSFNRPYLDGGGTGTFLWRWEFNMVRFLEREGYDVQYCSDHDLARRGSLIRNHHDLLVVGHPEYWSDDMRTNVTQARNNGVNIAFFSSNSCYWQIRYAPSAITGDADRTIVAYKEFAQAEDPYATDADKTNDRYVTTQWRSAPVNRPEAALVGQQYVYDPVTNGDVVIDDTTSAPWLFANTGLATGDHLPALLGYEVDAMTSSSPTGTIRIAHSPFTNNKTNPPSTQYSDMTLYTASGGALVFSTGTMQWAWGLDDWNSSINRAEVQPAVQQMTRNLLLEFAGSGSANDCQFTIAPASIATSATATSGSISLITASNCSWSASSTAPWLNVTSASSGSGNATIAYSIAQNAGVMRNASIAIGDKSVSVTQSECGYAISPIGATTPASGGSATVSVTADAGCVWSATPNASWITLTPSSGSGNGTVTLAFASTRGPQRNSSATIAGRTFSVTQTSGCTYSIAPVSDSAPFTGRNGSFALTASDSQCGWSAMSDSSWLTLRSASSGSGSATINYSVAVNHSPSREGEIDVAGARFTMSQDGGCSYTLDAATMEVASGGGAGSVNVLTDSECHWIVESHASWISVTSNVSWQGSGRVTFSVAPNTSGTSRIGTLTIAGNAFSVTQPAAGAPAHVVARATDTTHTLVTWDAVPNASRYEIARSSNNGYFYVIASSTTPSFSDSGLTPSTTYLYEVRAVDSSGTIGAFSLVDLATTMLFTDDPIVARKTPARATHLAELRIAVNAVRAAAGLSPRSWSDPSLAGHTIRTLHITELRDALVEARDALALPIAYFSDLPSVAGYTTISAAHITELRNAVK